MIQCKSCGRVIQDPRARFCPDCGRPLAPVVQRPGPKARQNRRRYEGERYHSPYRWVRWAVAGVVAVVVVFCALIGREAMYYGILGRDAMLDIPAVSEKETPREEEKTPPQLLAQQEQETADAGSETGAQPSPTVEPTPVSEPENPQEAATQPETEPTIALPLGGTAPAGDFLFPYSGTQSITVEELDAMFGGLEADAAYQAGQLAINEIYARYGYNFHPEKSDSATAAYEYFHSLDWYNEICPQSTAASLDQVPVNATEQQNIDTIAAWQAARGYR
ncbi:MAG: hypothetical protein ACI4KC_09310 [Gemmiger sp.]